MNKTIKFPELHTHVSSYVCMIRDVAYMPDREL